MSKSIEALENLVHCKSETKCKECKHKYRCTMERDYHTIKQGLERKEQLEKENEDLKVFVDAYANARDELLIRNQKLEKAIEIVFKHLDLYITNEGQHCMALGCLCSETGINKEDYELLNEVSEE